MNKVHMQLTPIDVVAGIQNNRRLKMGRLPPWSALHQTNACSLSRCRDIVPCYALYMTASRLTPPFIFVDFYFSIKSFLCQAIFYDFSKNFSQIVDKTIWIWYNSKYEG
ncbi:MAG: hypothetical protein FWH48_01800 [Oscillospiraceae bacterium]|nr:hypothetical protein [Oscillospiraceae bacterium]